MSDPDFEERYGEVYGGMHPDRQVSIVQPIFFLLRRYIFVFTICIPIFSGHSWLQIQLQLVLTIFSLIFLLHFDMFLESLVENLEIFNEITTLILLYHLLGFTKFIGDVHAQHRIGYSFILFLSANLVTHIFFLLRSSFRDCKRNWQVRKVKQKQRKIISEQKKKNE